MLYLVVGLPELMKRIHENLKRGGQLICKTWCFADMKRLVRALFPVLRAFGLFPFAASHGAAQLRRAIRDAGFEIACERLLGDYAQNLYIGAIKSGQITTWDGLTWVLWFSLCYQ